VVLDVQVSRNKERLCRLESAVVEKRAIEERYDPSDISVFEMKFFGGIIELLSISTWCNCARVTGLSSLQ